jgi:hypothetical protein
MAYAWFVCPYKRRARLFGNGNPILYCAMDDFTAQIRADGGDWAETRVLGNVALVKVRANATTLTTISGTAEFMQITSRWLLSDTLSALTTAQRNAIQNKLLAMGYPQTEQYCIRDKFDAVASKNTRNVT